jgi:hypothetical protein
MQPPTFRPGEAWTYRIAPAYAPSRLIVGAVFSFESGDVVCCAVTDAPRRLADGTIEITTIPFLPMSAAALAETVVAPDGSRDLPAEFEAGLAHWQSDPRGLSVFTVPFEGFLDHLIARQMAAILGVTAADAETAAAAAV